MTLKLLFVGPQGSGKTCIVDLLAEEFNGTKMEPVGETLKDKPYSPTVALRIIEIEVELERPMDIRCWGGRETIAVELWDCSGDLQYESCWPSIQSASVGVVLVFNPENAGQKGQISNWYRWFVKQNSLESEQCIVFANDRNSGHEDPRAKLPELLNNEQTEIYYTSHDDKDIFISAIQEFVGGLGKFAHSDCDSESKH